MTDPPAAAPGGLSRFLELQNLGLNLPFALAFLFAAAEGLPSWETFLLIVIAFIAARNAGHAFNRWADRRYDALNPRTRDRALVTGERSANFALAFALANAAILVVAAYFLNPLAFALSPLAVALIFGYSYSKRYSAWTTVFLGLVEAIIPFAMYVAVQGRVPPEALVATIALLLWGTAFETVHSLGDVDADRAAGLYSIPVRLGPRRSIALVPLLHAGALVLLAYFGVLAGYTFPFYVAILAMAGITAYVDIALARDPSETRTAFRWHFVLSAIFLVGTLLAVFVPLSL